MTATAEEIKTFWSRLDTLQDELDPDEILPFVEDSDRALWQTSHPTKKENDEPYYLTTYLCEMDPGPCERDLLEDLIRAKVPITSQCYKARMDTSFSAEMLQSLLDSGSVPPTIEGLKPLDGILHFIQRYLNLEEEEENEMAQDLFRGFVAKKLGKLQEGVTHTAKGKFDTWLGEAEQQEWLQSVDEEETDVPSPRSVAVSLRQDNKSVQKAALLLSSAAAKRKALQSSAATKRKTLQSSAATKRKAETIENGVNCPVCKVTFKGPEEVLAHIQGSRGKAHKKYNLKMKSEAKDAGSVETSEAKRARIVSVE